MMKRFVWLTVILSVALGCVRELPILSDGKGEPFPEGEKATITVSLSDSVMPATKALSETGDLQDLYLAVFGKNGYLKEYVKATKVAEGQYTADLTMTESKRTVHLLGNGPEFLPFGWDYNVLPSLTCADGASAFWQMIVLDNGIQAERSSDGKFVKNTNDTYKIDYEKTGKYFEDIELVRNWAKIVLQAKPKEVSFFEPLSYAVIYAPSQGTYLPYSTSFIPDYLTYDHDELEAFYAANLPKGTTLNQTIPEKSEFVSAATNPDYVGPLSKAYAYVDPEGESPAYQGGVYLYERPIPAEGLRPTALIVFGNYYQKSANFPTTPVTTDDIREHFSEWFESAYPCFHKIDLMQYVENPPTSGILEPRYYPVFRNFQYEVTITNILTKGSATPQEAANGAGSADVSADFNTRHLTDISDGTARLAVTPWLSKTFYTGQSDNQELRVIFFKNAAGQADTDVNSVVLSLQGSNGVILQGTDPDTGEPLLKVDPPFDDESDKDNFGWRVIHFSTVSAGAIARSQTLRIIGNYTSEGKPKRLYRDIVITLLAQQKMKLSLVYPDATDPVAGPMPRERGKQLKLNIDIPEGLTDSMFPLVFTVEAEKMTLSPDDDQTLPVNADVSISGSGKQAIQFLRTLTKDEYKELEVIKELNGNRWRRMVCSFKTTQADNATTIWVKNEYFSKDENPSTPFTISFENGPSKPLEDRDYFYVEAADNKGCTVMLYNDRVEFLRDEDEGWIFTSGNSANAIRLNNEGDRVYFRSRNKDWSQTNATDRFISTGNFNVGGNIASLVVGDDFGAEGSGGGAAQTGVNFNNFFDNETGLVDASELLLPMAGATYQYMFQGCTSLTKSPTRLDATTLPSNYCYRSMFNGCSALTTAPELPATTLKEGCYSAMFQGCTLLQTAPALPATGLAVKCYQNMFNGCTSLTTAPPTLSATTLENNCYQSMFQGCISLETSPELPATTLAKYCYLSMFKGCTSLEIAPELPAATLTQSCYESMFQECTSLKKAPALPATTLAANCYLSMFEGCTDLEKAPILRAPSLVDGCYKRMFADCTSLTEIKMLAKSNISAGTTQWVVDITTEGNYYGHVKATMTPSLPLNWNNRKDFYIEYTADTDGTVSYSGSNLKYSLNWGEWENCSAGMAISVKKDDIVLFKNSTSSTTPTSAVGGTFAASGSFNVGGDLKSLVAGDSYLQATSLPEGAFAGLFKVPQNEVSNLVSAKQLVFPDNLISINCYKEMFSGCTSLTEVPTLRATTLAKACYKSMFSGCTSLATAPALSVKTLAESCYESMFSDCTGLTAAPTLSATTLAKACYKSMFSGCTNEAFTSAPALSVKNLEESCYESMFSGCTGLTSAPALPATTLAKACYKSMFSGCNNDSFTSASLPATTLAESCYQSMFSGAGNISMVSLSATNVPYTNCFEDWLLNVARKGFLLKTSGLSLPSQSWSGIPPGWSLHAPFFIEARTACKVSISKSDVKYSEDGVNWYTLDESKDLSVGKKLFFSASITDWTGKPVSVTNGNFAIGGSLASLIVGPDYESEGPSAKDWKFENFMNGKTNLLDASMLELPMTTITASGYKNFFSGCTNLVSGPLELPATSIPISGYESMFSGCSNLTSAPAIRGEIIDNYGLFEMFANCSKLVTAPVFAPKKIISTASIGSNGGACQQMFKYCDLLSDISGVNIKGVTQMKKYCFRAMFERNSITSAPELPAAEVPLAEGCYRYMFSLCIKLTKAPELKAKKLVNDCYNHIFDNCYLLEEVKIYAEENITNNALNAWLNNAGRDVTSPVLYRVSGVNILNVPDKWEKRDL